MKLKDFKKFNIPDKPGVYFFLSGRRSDIKNSNGTTLRSHEVLYIGKATSLKDRVRSYFSKDLINTRGPLLVDMVFKAGDLKWQEADSVLEALILEANLIKKYQPYYNTKEKDDKSFNYVCITSENKLRTIRGRELKQSHEKYKKVFGPYANGGQLREALKIIRKFFPYIEDRSGTKGKEEFYKQIKLLPENSTENAKNIRHIILFFEGRKKLIIKNLTKEMNSLAKEKRFEEANLIKKKIFALRHINDVALIKESDTESTFFSGTRLLAIGSPRPFKKSLSGDTFRVEAYDIAHLGGKNMVGAMVVLEGGEPNKKEYRKFLIKTQKDANDTGALLEVLERRFAHPEWPTPDMVVVDGGVAQINTAKKFFKEIRLTIPVVSVQKNEKHQPERLLGDKKITINLEKDILLANSEAHRFAIAYHKKTRAKNFLK